MISRTLACTFKCASPRGHVWEAHGTPATGGRGRRLPVQMQVGDRPSLLALLATGTGASGNILNSGGPTEGWGGCCQAMPAPRTPSPKLLLQSLGPTLPRGLRSSSPALLVPRDSRDPRSPRLVRSVCSEKARRLAYSAINLDSEPFRILLSQRNLFCQVSPFIVRDQPIPMKIR